MDFWKQVGRENGAKIDPRRHRKREGKMEGTKMATRCEEEAKRNRGPRGPEPWGGRGRGKPLPEGRGEGGSGKLPVLHSKPPQPKGWWDFLPRELLCDSSSRFLATGTTIP